MHQKTEQAENIIPYTISSLLSIHLVKFLLSKYKWVIVYTYKKINKPNQDTKNTINCILC